MTVGAFQESLSGLLEHKTEPVFKIVADLGGVEYVASAGFRALLAAQRIAKRYNRGEIILANASGRINEALELSGFSEVFKQIELVDQK